MPELLIYDVIDEWGESSPIAVSDFLRNHASEAIDVRINSGGGSVFAGFAIYQLISAHPHPVTVHIDGIAASMASVIAMAGNDIRMSDTSMMMLHQPWAWLEGSADDMRAKAELLDKMYTNILGVYAKKSSWSADELRGLIDDAGDLWLTADEALDMGLISQVTESGGQMAASIDLHRYKNLPQGAQQYARKTKTTSPEPNSMAEPTKNSPDLKAYCDEFGKADGAEYVLAGYDLPSARVEHGKKQLAHAQASLVKIEAERDELKADVKAKADEIESLKAKVAELAQSGETPGKASDSDSTSEQGSDSIDIKAEHSKLVAEGKSKTEAWKELNKKHPQAYAKHFNIHV